MFHLVVSCVHCYSLEVDEYSLSTARTRHHAHDGSVRVTSSLPKTSFQSQKHLVRACNMMKLTKTLRSAIGLEQDAAGDRYVIRSIVKELARRETVPTHRRCAALE